MIIECPNGVMPLWIIDRYGAIRGNTVDICLEQGHTKYHIEECDIADFLRQPLEIHRLRISNAGLTLFTDIPEEPVFITTEKNALDKTFLKQYRKCGFRRN